LVEQTVERQFGTEPLVERLEQFELFVVRIAEQQIVCVHL
jgi:hypothetical protein